MRRHFTASMVALDVRERNVLLVHHKAMGKWVFPGGHIDEITPGWTETPQQAAWREVYEETGVKASTWQAGARILLGQVWLPTPWITSLNDAPAKPERTGADGVVKPAEGAHEHIDFLFIGQADSLLQPVTAAPVDEAHGARWVHVSEVWKLDTRAEVLDLTWEALSLLEK